MATVTLQLRDGLTIGQAVHTEAVLREATAGDVLDGTAEAERLVQTPDGAWKLVHSPALAALQILYRRIVRIGAFKGAITPALVKKLSARDLSDLQIAANRLDGASLEAALTGLGESGSASGAPPKSP